jgi:hypothetical protein
MKIEKLITLSEFVDLLGKERPFAIEAPMSEEADNYIAIFDYNNFLKQPLTKDMFVNSIQEPTLQCSDPMYYECELLEYQEAESKVIFEGWNLVNSGFMYNESYPQLEISAKMYITIDWNHSFRKYDSLHDLAEATKGTLKLKNVQI